MARLEIIVLQHDDERLALANALIRALGDTAGSVRRGELGALPDDCAMIVFASELPAYLAALPRARRVKLIERTLVLNAYRDEVLALLEAHGLGGAIECEDPDGWTADGKMFVRKEALAPRKGEPVPGDGRESDRYVLWTLYDRTTMVTGSLANLVASYASECGRFANRHDALMVTSAEARAHGLPAISLRVRALRQPGRRGAGGERRGARAGAPCDQHARDPRPREHDRHAISIADSVFPAVSGVRGRPVAERGERPRCGLDRRRRARPVG